MEQAFNWGELLEIALPIALTAGGGLLAWAFLSLRKFVAASETKVDDKILAAIEKALADSKSPE